MVLQDKNAQLIPLFFVDNSDELEGKAPFDISFLIATTSHPLTAATGQLVGPPTFRT